MAGIYIHIPFCRQACTYCNFHFTTSLHYKDAFLAALTQEIELQQTFLQGAEIETIYFGGGTPSVLSALEINSLIKEISRFHQISPDVEITIEANPEDLTPAVIEELANTRVNRLSIGIQSFRNDDLLHLNRLHNSDRAVAAVTDAAQAGFNNISIDLIYGIPGLTEAYWTDNLRQAFDLPIQHLSCYALTVEPRTPLAKMIRNGAFPAVDEDTTSHHFDMLMDFAEEHGWEHYEISNLALPGAYSRHNTSYWKNVPYLGLGPAAHSFNGIARQWNMNNNQRYIRSIQEGIVPFQIEGLTVENRYNEYVMTRLRTQWGADLYAINTQFGESFGLHFQEQAQVFLKSGMLTEERSIYRLTRTGKHFADGVAAKLFI